MHDGSFLKFLLDALSEMALAPATAPSMKFRFLHGRKFDLYGRFGGWSSKTRYMYRYMGKYINMYIFLMDRSIRHLPPCSEHSFSKKLMWSHSSFELGEEVASEH
jgi:hypothetical protein